MKKNTVLLTLISMFSMSASVAHPPQGERVIEILLAHQDVALTKENEPLCAIEYFQGEKITLGKHLAMVLSSAFVADHTTTVSSQCQTAKHQAGDKLLDTWDCDLQINVIDKAGEYISGSTIMFALNQGDLTWLPGSLRCF